MCVCAWACMHTVSRQCLQACTCRFLRATCVISRCYNVFSTCSGESLTRWFMKCVCRAEESGAAENQLSLCLGAEKVRGCDWVTLCGRGAASADMTWVCLCEEKGEVMGAANWISMGLGERKQEECCIYLPLTSLSAWIFFSNHISAAIVRNS